MSQRERGLELKVGLLLLAAAALAGAFVVVLGGYSFGRGERFSVDFDYSGSLQAGAPVKIAGIKVGKVEEVAFLGGRLDPQVGRRVQVRVAVWVEERAREAIREDAECFVNTAGVLGEQYLEIAPGDYAKPPLAPGSIVRGVDPPRTDLIVARLYDFLDSATATLRQNQGAIRDVLQSGAGLVRTLDAVLRENQPELGKLIADLDRFTVEASGLARALRQGIGDARTLSATLANVEATSRRVRQDIGPVLDKTQRALDGVARATAVVGPGDREKVGRALDELVSIGGKVDGITGDLAALVGDVRRGKGTAGALLVDPQIYDDLKELVRDLKRNPWKFFWKE